MMAQDVWEVWVDGACSGNPGVGGWACVIVGPEGLPREVSGRVWRTTNVRMEMQAAIMGLLSIPEGREVTVYSDSELVVKGMTEWAPAWRLRTWRRADGKPVDNADLWQILWEVASRRRVTWTHVRGHTGVTLNERANQLAQQAAGPRYADVARGLVGPPWSA